MNLLLKQKLKDVFNDLRELDYQIDLVEEKISLQQKYISEMKQNKKKLLTEKNVLVNGNEEEIFMRQAEIDLLKKENDGLLASIDDKIDLDKKLTKLKDIKSTLMEKHRTHSRLIGFFEKNEDCPTCQQHIDEKFKENMIGNKQGEVDKLSSGLDELESELLKSNTRLKEISDIAKKIRDNEVHVAKDKSSVDQLEKFNTTLQQEIDELNSGEVHKSDYEELRKLKKSLTGTTVEKSKLKEEQIYSDAVRNMLMDSGIKTKIIKQ